jgi:hypothetical protein
MVSGFLVNAWRDALKVLDMCQVSHFPATDGILRDIYHFQHNCSNHEPGDICTLQLFRALLVVRNRVHYSNRFAMIIAPLLAYRPFDVGV